MGGEDCRTKGDVEKARRFGSENHDKITEQRTWLVGFGFTPFRMMEKLESKMLGVESPENSGGRVGSPGPQVDALRVLDGAVGARLCEPSSVEEISRGDGLLDVVLPLACKAGYFSNRGCTLRDDSRSHDEPEPRE